MLHLFNKVYLEFDDKIDINYDRIVISEQHGLQMYNVIDKIAYGELMTYGKTYEEVVTESFVGFISSIRDHAANSGKKVIIYCDNDAYKKFMAQWFAVILPGMTKKEFRTIVDYTIYNQRITSNTQLSSVYSTNLKSLWEGVGSIDDAWKKTKAFTEHELETFKQLDINFSYEFLLAAYLSGDDTRKEELRKTMHMFLRRWFKELLTDNRQMVLLNLTNHKFLSTFNIGSIDITSLDPLSGVKGFELYADDEIWERDQNQYGVCKLEGLSEEKAKGIADLLVSVYDKFEGMQIDRSVFGMLQFITAATKETLTDEEMESIIEYVVNTPCDTCLVPRFDFQNVNFPLMQYFLSQKFNGKDLSKYRLL